VDWASDSTGEMCSSAPDVLPVSRPIGSSAALVCADLRFPSLLIGISILQ
jgi:hypothetical protein